MDGRAARRARARPELMGRMQTLGLLHGEAFHKSSRYRAAELGSGGTGE